MSIQLCFGDEERELSELSNMGDPLEKLLAIIDFEVFRSLLEEAFSNPARTHRCGRPSWDCVLIFKILILQQLYNISDEQTEYQIRDRLTFRRFLGLSRCPAIPDAKTIWNYRDKLAKSGKSKALFELYTNMLENSGLITKSGSIVDSTFVEAPRQRNTREENKTIKNGKTPEEWLANTPAMSHKLAQKDRDARWAKKHKKSYFGFKNHVKVDLDSKLIVAFCVTNASVHDSHTIVQLVDSSDQVIFADAAYAGAPLRDVLSERYPNAIQMIHERGARCKPLSKQQKADNAAKSSVRCRVEHVFGHMKKAMGGAFIRSIGIARATVVTTLRNLAYNFSRIVHIMSKRTGLTVPG